MKFASWYQKLYVICIGVFFAQLSFAIVNPFLPIILLEIGIETKTSLWAGLITSINFIIYGLMAPVWGILSDKYGRKIMLLRSSLGISITFLLIVYAQNLLQVVLIRMLNGALTGYVPAAIILIASIVPVENTRYSMGLIQAVSEVGGIVGPIIGGIIAENLGVRYTFFYASIILFFVALLPYVFNLPEEKRKKDSTSVKESFKYIFQNRFLLLLYLVYMLIQASFMGIQSILPLYIREIISANADIYTGMSFSAVGISMALGAIFISKYKKASIQVLLKYGLLFECLFTVFQGKFNTGIGLCIMRFLFGFAHAAVMVSFNVLVTRICCEHNIGSTFGILNTAGAVGFIIGPLIIGFIAEYQGLNRIFFAASILLIIAFIMLCKMLYREDS